MLKTLIWGWPLMLATALAMTLPPWEISRRLPPERSWEEQLAAVSSGDEVWIVVDQSPIGDREVADLKGLRGVKALELGRSELTVAGVAELARLPRLERVILRGRPVDDALFAALCRIPTIRFLNLPDTIITDQGLVALDACPHLIQLRIASPNISDAGMRHIAGLHELKGLHLIDIPITDRGLASLGELTQLESLYIDGAEITDHGIERLLKELPELHFHIDQAHHDRDPRRGTHVHE